MADETKTVKAPAKKVAAKDAPAAPEATAEPTADAAVSDVAVQPPAEPPAPAKKVAAKPKPRIEVFAAVRPDGESVIVRRNIDTGVSEVE